MLTQIQLPSDDLADAEKNCYIFVISMACCKCFRDSGTSCSFCYVADYIDMSSNTDCFGFAHHRTGIQKSRRQISRYCLVDRF